MSDSLTRYLDVPLGLFLARSLNIFVISLLISSRVLEMALEFDCVGLKFGARRVKIEIG